MPVRFPTRLAVHGLFGSSAQLGLFFARRREFRLQLGKHGLAPLASARFLLEFGAQFLKPFSQLRQFGLTLPAQRLLRAYGILEARDFRLQFVVGAVGLVKSRLRLRLLLARGEHARLQTPVLRLDPGKLRFPGTGIDLRPLEQPVQFANVQRQALRLHLPLLAQVLAVAPGRRGLALEPAQTAGQLRSPLRQPLQVLAGTRNAQGGLAPPLPVARHTRRLLEIGAQFIRTPLHQKVDHALLDDGVTAYAEAGTGEHLGDVLAPAAGIVQKVLGNAVAPHRAPHGDFTVVGEPRVRNGLGIVEQQLHGSRPERRSPCRTVEDDFGHRPAAKLAGGDFAQHPAYRVDDVRFSAAVGADYGEGFRGNLDVDRVRKGLEPGQADPLKAH